MQILFTDKELTTTKHSLYHYQTKMSPDWNYTKAENYKTMCMPEL